MANGFSLHLEQDSLPVPETGGNPVTVTLRAGSARITRLSLEGGELVLTIRAQLENASLAAENLVPPSAQTGGAEAAPVESISRSAKTAESGMPGEEAEDEKPSADGGQPPTEIPERYGEPEPEIEAAAITEAEDFPAFAKKDHGGDGASPEEKTENAGTGRAEESAIGETAADVATDKPEPLPRLQASPPPNTAEQQQTTHIRYVCPRCHQPGEKEVGKIGSIVTCANCGRAMRLTFKK